MGNQALPEIPVLQPIARRPLDLADATVIRHVYQDRIIELEDALRGMVGLVQLLNASGDLKTDPRKNHRFITALDALK